MMPQSSSTYTLGTSHSSPNPHQLPHCIFLNLINGLNLFPFKGDFSFGKSQKSQATKFGSWVAVWIKSLATVARCSFCSICRSQNEFCHNTFHAQILHQNLRHRSFGIPRSASNSLTVSCRSLLIAACTHSTFLHVLLVAGLPGHGSLLTDSWPSLKHLCHTFICVALVISSLKAFWIIQIVSTEECTSLMQNLIQIHCYIHLVILNVMAAQTHAHSMVSTAPTD